MIPKWSRIAMVVALLPFCGCSRSLEPSLIFGDWSGRDVPAHFAYIEIRFERDGNDITGKACRFDGVSLGFTDSPVTVDGRRITFSVPVGSRPKVFRGEFDSAGTQINGGWTDSPQTRITLKRGGSYCANARTPLVSPKH